MASSLEASTTSSPSSTTTTFKASAARIETHPSFYPVVDKFRPSAGNAWRSTATTRRRSTTPSSSRKRRPAAHGDLQNHQGQGRELYGERAHLALPLAQQGRIRAGACARSTERPMRNTFSEDALRMRGRRSVASISSSPTSRRPAAWRSSARNIPSASSMSASPSRVMIGICAGLALKGCQPFAYTIATFSLYRPFEMVRDDLCYQNLPVTVVGMGAGVIYSTLGGTHHTMEDVAIASAIPNMQIAGAVRSRRNASKPHAGARSRRTGRSICASAKPASPTSPSRRRAVGVRQAALPAARHATLHSVLWHDHRQGGRGRRAPCAARANPFRSSRATPSSRLTATASSRRSRRHKQVIVIEEHVPRRRPCLARQANRLGHQGDCQPRHLHA